MSSPASFDFIAALRKEARAAGFDVVGAAPLSSVGDARLSDWLDRGYAGEMHYIGAHRTVRERPLEGFAPYRSVVSLIAEYATDAPVADPRIGNIARYALGDDYHDVLKRKSFEFLDRLRAADPTLEARVLVDTAPLLEKIAAVRAGIGWQGKNTNLIRTDRGSYFFLFEVLLNRDVPTVAAEAADRCGLCERCIVACPTGAILAPYVLDARRCISYLTIELRGAIPKEFRAAIGARIFGCDDCQEVCPWNRFARENAVAELRARPGLRDRSLADWLRMDEEEWRTVFRRSAVKRAKYAGFMRNVAVAIGNSGDREAVGTIGARLFSLPPLVREHLYDALRRIGGEEARAIVRQASGRETDPSAESERRIAADALADE